MGQTREGKRKAAWLRWGLVPHWAKEEKVGYKMINVRAVTIVTTQDNETVAELHDRMTVLVGEADFDSVVVSKREGSSSCSLMRIYTAACALRCPVTPVAVCLDKVILFRVLPVNAPIEGY